MSEASRQGAADGSFRARIYRVGILRCVDVPPEVGAAFADWRHPPVRAQVGGVELRTHMAPAGDGIFRIYLDGRLRERIGADTGDEVEVAVELDESLQAEPFPEDLLERAAALEGGLPVLETLPPGLKRQILGFLGAAKSEPTRRKRLNRIEEIIRERAVKQGLVEGD